ncbi:uncharacterized membrane-anchored protein YjiN (DUF445 family) [Leucobacter luti]|uniref:Uncharacterized membrane-anchored protein YjiN (DUF445 family) n=1 Tax=Leucobacter luti TaxID=340320 RepID=A0A4R6S739_9MICO|nr:DUF445 family protein [Leucobacter luti]TDP95652.1 uncharacterized membrane-anchored protein YjiN (DUF445 family) [Leucobacter luti]
MPKSRTRRTLGAVSPADFQRLGDLRRMQAIAVGLLIGMAVVFVVSFVLQERYPWLGYVRAASEGGMVGALADWFAVTALFRHPLGIKIPHTNLISNKKDEIGEGLGSFVEENFLADEVVHEKLSQVSGARMAGTWLLERPNAERVGEMISSAGLGAITVLDDGDVRELIEVLVRRHMIEPEWGPLLGRAAESFVDGGHHEALLDIAAGRLEEWLVTHPEAFDRVVSSRLPSWVPSVVDKFVDTRLHAEAVKFAQSVAADPEHPFRIAVGRFLGDLARDLQEQERLQDQLEHFKHEVFDSPRIRALAASTWETARAALVAMLEDPASDLRVRLVNALQDFGHKLVDDSTLQYKIDVWVMGVVEHLVSRYRHDLAGVISETVQRWDAREAAEKIELQVGKDLQFIRINGTVVGSLAGLTIYTIATLVITPLIG